MVKAGHDISVSVLDTVGALKIGANAVHFAYNVVPESEEYTPPAL